MPTPRRDAGADRPRYSASGYVQSWLAVSARTLQRHLSAAATPARRRVRLPPGYHRRSIVASWEVTRYRSSHPAQGPPPRGRQAACPPLPASPAVDREDQQHPKVDDCIDPVAGEQVHQRYTQLENLLDQLIEEILERDLVEEGDEDDDYRDDRDDECGDALDAKARVPQY